MKDIDLSNPTLAKQMSWKSLRHARLHTALSLMDQTPNSPTKDWQHLFGSQFIDLESSPQAVCSLCSTFWMFAYRHIQRPSAFDFCQRATARPMKPSFSLQEWMAIRRHDLPLVTTLVGFG